MKEHCKQTLVRAYLILDGEPLEHAERLEIEAHLEECEPCYERYGLEREVKVLIARLKDSCTCPDGLKTKIARLLEDA
ncbi:MAG: zf-HC2 domain-containing protein [Actinomycetota bacterium]